jgi:hypothetical protein
MPVHPAAAVFPMLADDELDELAADIATHGLRQALIVKDGQLIDGRNRREACQRANVEPRIEELNGVDPVAYILSVNINRRHLTKGQRAMAVAKLYPESRQGKKTSVKITEVSSEYVKHARTVLAWLPQIADAVLAGNKPLGEAYQEAQRLKEQADAEPQRLARLWARAADLADLVHEGRMSLIEAESAYATRTGEQRRERQAALDSLEGLERHLDFFAAGPRRQHILDIMCDLEEDRGHLHRLLDQWLENLLATKEALILCPPPHQRSNGS